MTSYDLDVPSEKNDTVKLFQVNFRFLFPREESL